MNMQRVCMAVATKAQQYASAVCAMHAHLHWARTENERKRQKEHSIMILELK